MILFGLLLLLEPATLLLEYRFEPRGELTIAWSTRTTSGHVSRPFSAEDAGTITRLAAAVARPDGEWKALSLHAAELLLGGIEPPDNVRRIVVVTPNDGPLRALPFEVLGNPALIERFAVSYYPSAPTRLVRLWPAPPDDAFMQEPKAEALRQAKIKHLRLGAHPYYWAGLVLHGGHPAASGDWLLPRSWWIGLALFIPSAAFLIWWRRRRFELL